MLFGRGDQGFRQYLVERFAGNLRGIVKENLTMTVKLFKENPHLAKATFRVFNGRCRGEGMEGMGEEKKRKKMRGAKRQKVAIRKLINGRAKGEGTEGMSEVEKKKAMWDAKRARAAIRKLLALNEGEAEGGNGGGGKG